MRWLVWMPFLLVACVEPEPEPVPVVWLDPGVFETEVLPILGERCGTPSCHGRPDRPLSIYSTGRWRADPDETHLPTALTAAEFAHDYTAACTFAAHDGAAGDAPLLHKPLGELVGGYHGGGVVFDGLADREYRALAAWIEGVMR